MTPSKRWEELQVRWSSGEVLSPEEERERLELGAQEALSRRELELFAELRQRVAAGEIPSGTEALVERALHEARGRPPLRVVTGDEPAPAQRTAGKRPRVALAAGAFAVALAAGVALFVASRPGEVASTELAPPRSSTPALARSELVLSSGEVEVFAQSQRVGGGPLARGDRIKTGQGSACLTVDPGVDVCIGARSEIVLESLDQVRTSVRVEAGTALATLTPREAGRTFSLAGGGLTATARGTVFALQRAAGEAGTEVVVLEGSVEVARGDGPPEAVGAHSRLRFVSAGPGEKSAIGRGEEAQLRALAAPRDLWAGTDVGVLEIRGRQPGLSVSIDQGAELALPVRVFVPAGTRRVALRGASETENISTVAIKPGETRELELPDVALKTDARSPSAKPSASSMLDAARAELARGNTGGALRLYQQLRSSFPQSPEAVTVLVTMGKLELDSKQAAQALRHFDAYLAAGGPLRQEALAGKISALRALGRTAEEKRAIMQYLERHPNGFDAVALKKRLELLDRP